MKLKSPSFWIYLVLILYLVSMLVYVSVEFFGGSDTNKIAAFGAVLGGVGTFFAAFTAWVLFSDWREQHNKQVLAFEAKENFKLIYLERDCIHELRFICEDISQNKLTKHISWHSITTGFENNLVNLFNQNKDKMSSFHYLSQGEDIYTLMENYHSELESVAKFLYAKKSQPCSETIFLNSQMGAEVLLLVQGIEKKNGEVLDELKSISL